MTDQKNEAAKISRRGIIAGAALGLGMTQAGAASMPKRKIRDATCCWPVDWGTPAARSAFSLPGL